MTRRARSLVGHPNLIVDTMNDIARDEGYEIETNPPHLWGQNEWDTVYVKLSDKKLQATFQVQQMPGCCAVLIASYFEIVPHTKETFNTVIGFLERANQEAGFGSLMLSQVLYEKNGRKHVWGGLLDEGWEMSKPFVNAKSGNQVVYLTKDMGQKGKRNGLEIQL
jgi:hypothetical protein